MPDILPKPFLACTRFLSLVLVLLSLALTTAAAPFAPNPVWKITVSGKTREVCLGDKILFMARWQPNPTYVDPLAPLDSSGEAVTLAPLAGPRKILAKASLGSFEPQTETPGVAMGVAEFTYKAEKKGSETVTFQVFNDSLEVDTSITKTFEVHKCDYLFTLVVKDEYSTTTDRGPYTMFTVMTAKGTLKAIDSVDPNLYEAYDKQINSVLTVTQIMDCQINTNEPARAFGFVDAKAVKDEEGSIILRIGPPKDYDAVVNFTAVCPGGDPFSVGLSKDVSGGGDPWIEKEYPLGEGTLSLDSRKFNPAIPKMEAAGFSVVSTGWLKLEKIVK